MYWTFTEFCNLRRSLCLCAINVYFKNFSTSSSKLSPVMCSLSANIEQEENTTGYITCWESVTDQLYTFISLLLHTRATQTWYWVFCSWIGDISPSFIQYKVANIHPVLLVERVICIHSVPTVNSTGTIQLQHVNVQPHIWFVCIQNSPPHHPTQKPGLCLSPKNMLSEFGKNGISCKLGHLNPDCSFHGLTRGNQKDC